MTGAAFAAQLGGQHDLSLSRFAFLKYGRYFRGLALDQPMLGDEQSKQPVQFLVEFVMPRVYLRHEYPPIYPLALLSMFHSRLYPCNGGAVFFDRLVRPRPVGLVATTGVLALFCVAGSRRRTQSGRATKSFDLHFVRPSAVPQSPEPFGLVEQRAAA